MSKYPKTPQQRKVEIGGKMIREMCTGLKGNDFSKCRREVLRCAFDDEECEEDMIVVKGKIKDGEIE